MYAAIALVCSLAGVSATSDDIAVGDPAPTLGVEALLQAPAEASLSWDDLLGSPVVIEFWGTWCSPCVAAIPHLNELAEQYQDRIRFLAVTYEESTTIENFLERQLVVSWIGLDTDQSMVASFGVRGWPTTVLVDRSGRIAAITYPTHVTPAVLDDLLAGREPSLFQRDLRASAGHAKDSEHDPALFEVTVRSSPGTRSTLRSTADGLVVEGQPLDTLLPIAYETRRTRIAVEAIPLPAEPLDVTVRVPHADGEILLRFLRLALEQTFGFRVRREEREVDVYAMRIVESAKMTVTTAADGVSSANSSPSGFEVTGVDTESLAVLLEQRLGRPVVDEVRSTERYDLRFECSSNSPSDLRHAVEEQLGLLLEPTQSVVEMLVLERGAN